MTTIDAAGDRAGAGDPQVGLRLVTTYDEVSRRVDIALRGSQGVLVEDGVSTPFPLERLWPVLRDGSTVVPGDLGFSQPPIGRELVRHFSG